LKRWSRSYNELRHAGLDTAYRKVCCARVCQRYEIEVSLLSDILMQSSQKLVIRLRLRASCCRRFRLATRLRAGRWRLSLNRERAGAGSCDGRLELDAHRTAAAHCQRTATGFLATPGEVAGVVSAPKLMVELRYW